MNKHKNKSENVSTTATKKQSEFYKVTGFPFGKYKGRLVKDVPAGYLVWARSQDVHKEFSQLMKWAILKTIKDAGIDMLHFGQYKGIPISEIPIKYLKWVRSEKNYRFMPVQTRRIINDIFERENERYEIMNFEIEDFQLN